MGMEEQRWRRCFFFCLITSLYPLSQISALCCLCVKHADTSLSYYRFIITVKNSWSAVAAEVHRRCKEMLRLLSKPVRIQRTEEAVYRQKYVWPWETTPARCNVPAGLKNKIHLKLQQTFLLSGPEAVNEPLTPNEWCTNTISNNLESCQFARCRVRHSEVGLSPLGTDQCWCRKTVHGKSIRSPWVFTN